MPWIIENYEELREFKAKMEEAKKIRSQERHKRERENMERILNKILEAIKRESEKESDPPEIDKIKQLLEKLKKLFLGGRIPRRIEDLLEAILKNLDSTDPVEFKALESFVKDFFAPILSTYLERWDQETRDEASLEIILDHLIEKGVTKI